MLERGKVFGTAAGTALATVALGLSGCGGGQGEPTGSISSVPTTSAAGPRAQGNSANQGSRAPSRAHSQTRAESSAQSRAREAVRKLPESQRARLVTTVTRAVFSRFGFTSPTFTVTSGGNGVRAVLSSGEACTATDQTERSLAGVVRKGVPWLNSVQIVVGTAGEPLSQYVRAHCRPVTLPAGPGQVLANARGTGFGATSSFTVQSSRWAIEYINGGSLLEILILKKGLPTGQRFTAAKRGPGRYTVSGSGTYSLQIVGTGDWIARVRDGA